MSRALIAQPTKVCWKCDAIERLCHGLFLPHTQRKNEALKEERDITHYMYLNIFD
ncbi:MAG: hypothetical protein NVSMB27_34420 [Ktedonobacteraceae bacterium]